MAPRSDVDSARLRQRRCRRTTGSSRSMSRCLHRHPLARPTWRAPLRRRARCRGPDASRTALATRRERRSRRGTSRGAHRPPPRRRGPRARRALPARPLCVPVPRGIVPRLSLQEQWSTPRRGTGQREQLPVPELVRANHLRARDARSERPLPDPPLPPIPTNEKPRRLNAAAIRSSTGTDVHLGTLAARSPPSDELRSPGTDHARALRRIP